MELNLSVKAPFVAFLIIKKAYLLSEVLKKDIENIHSNVRTFLNKDITSSYSNRK